MSYYRSDDKLTFDRAEQLVERFIETKSGIRTRCTSKDVAKEFEVEETHHNLIRLNRALSDRLEVSRESGTRATQYQL